MRKWATTMLAGLAVSAGLGGCVERTAGFLTPPEPSIVWPKPPDAPRVRYLGSLASTADLAPQKSLADAWRELLYGPAEPVRLVRPHAVAVSADAGLVAVTDAELACVHLFDLNRRTYRRLGGWAPRNVRPCPVGVSWADDVLWIADAGLPGVVGVQADGEVQARVQDVLRRPAGIAWSPLNQRLYVADAAAHCLYIFDETGRPIRRLGHRGSGPGEFNYPSQVACGPDGTVVVADSLNFRIQRFDPQGRWLAMFGRKGDAAGDFALPKGVAVDPEGHIWVVDAHFENVQAFTPQGQLLLAFGEEGHGPGQFWLPAGICIDALRRMWIADSYNRRVQVFELLP